MSDLGPLFAPKRRLTTRPATVKRWHWTGPVLELLMDGVAIGVVRDRRIWGALQGLEPGEIKGPKWRWIVDGPGCPRGVDDCETAEEAIAGAEAHLVAMLGPKARSA